MMCYLFVSTPFLTSCKVSIDLQYHHCQWLVPRHHLPDIRRQGKTPCSFS
ncbi:hypothetical protein Plhal304r1_c056g0141851 [Plasmopara halstedii]